MQITECKDDVLHMSLHTRPACNVNLGLGLSSSSSSAALPSSTSTASPAASSSISMASPSAKPPPAIAMPAAVHLAYAQQTQTPFQSRSLLDHEQAFLRHTPVQLDLLPLGPASTFKNAQAAPPPTASLSATPPQAFMWQQRLMPSNLMNNIQPPMRGIDVNQIPSSADYEDVVGETSPTGMFSSMATESMCRTTDSGLPLKRERDRLSDLEQERTCEVSSRASDEEAEGGGTRKKLRLSKEQSALLEESFKEHPTLNPKQKAALAKQLSLRPRQVEVWFQNRRARTKLKQTEVDCELLKRCCESLTEENRRLLKEVQELRAIKVAPPCVIAHDLYMPLPAATLTMCPSCAATTTTGGAGRMSGSGNASGNAAAAFHAANVKSGLPVSLPSALPLPLPVPTHHHHHHQQPLSQPSAAC